MRIVINLLLALLIVALGYVLYSSIKEPIEFNNEKERRERRVIDKLTQIRTAQEAYRDIVGVFAPTFDTLRQVLNTGNFTVIGVIGDPDDPNFTGEITYDTTYMPAKDSLLNMGILLDSLEYIPFGNGAKFEVSADTISYQSTKVPVVQVGTQRKIFMGKYGVEKYRKYDAKYDPNSVIKFGDLNKPNLAGNWEK